MPPHCDALDGPVVQAARLALETGDVGFVLPYVPKTGEAEIASTFARVSCARQASAVARDVADRYFFETVVRIHRAGEGAAFTGIKPAGLDVGPVIPAAEKAIASDDPTPLADLLAEVVRGEVIDRFERLVHLRPAEGASVDDRRAYVETTLGLEVWAHGLYQAARAARHVGHVHA